MEGVLKELGEWAAANPDVIPQHLRQALRADATDNSLSQAGPSEPCLPSSGKLVKTGSIIIIIIIL